LLTDRTNGRYYVSGLSGSRPDPQTNTNPACSKKEDISMKSTKCISCGFVGFSDAGNCKACGAPIIGRPQTFAQSSPYSSFEPPQEGLKQGLAIFSLVLGIISLFTFGLLGIGAIIGIIVAVVAMGKAKREPWKYGGRGLAIAGLALSITSFATVVPLGIIASIAVPNLLAAKRAANEASAINALRRISSAETSYASNYGRFGTLAELEAERLIDPVLASGVKKGYCFTVELKPADDLSAGGFQVTGVPLKYGTSGRRSFFIDESFVVRAADNHGAPPSVFDPPLSSDHEYRTRRSPQREFGTDVGY
jgi:type II secretory pathway pseudopilin PulG